MRICKVVKRRPRGIANSYNYAIWCYRVVECEPNQAGNLNERGVRCIWESENITYYSEKPTSKNMRALTEARRIAEHGTRCLSLGFDFSTPPGVIDDYYQEYNLVETLPSQS